MKTSTGVGCLLQSVAYAYLLKVLHFQNCLIIAGIINNCILVSHYILISDKVAGGINPYINELKNDEDKSLLARETIIEDSIVTSR